MGRSLFAMIAAIATLGFADAVHGQTGASAAPPPRRLQVLFLGAPTGNGPHHDPITRYRTLKRGLGADGIDLTYREDPAEAFTPATLAPFDAVLLYGNWEPNGTLPEPQLQALLAFVENGGGFVPVHCASACWGRSPKFVRLVGGRFQSHGGEEFTVANVAKDHPVLQGIDGFSAWDETYVHDEHALDRTILQTRNGEPWTWVRTQGKGRVFYTAAGHDHRVWDLPAFQQLLRRGIEWAAGDAALARLRAVGLPTLEQETVSLPGYRERKEITRAQKPLAAAESQKLAMVPVGMELQLFASEPDIVNPIHIAWDHRGRAFVTETVDYPNNLQSGDLGHDRITICTDTNGDGLADRFTRFAEKLSIPTAVTFANGGVVCTNGQDILFLADTDGDDIADVRKVLFTGFHMGDTHAGISNLLAHHDGWIWATVGYSGFRGDVGGKRHEFSQGVLRFRADGEALEFIQNTTNNTWGLGITAAGHVVGSTANGNPSFFVTFPQGAYRAVGMTPPTTPRADDDPKFFPMSADIRQVDFFDRFTAAAGHAIATGHRLPAAWHDRVAFVCEPTGKLVAAFELQRQGASFVARQTSNPVFASADAWTSPVCAEVGPDGALWICDWYNLIIQHNPTPTKGSAGVAAQTGRGNAYETPLRDTQHGRIWRVFPRGSANEAAPTLTGDAAALVAGLDHGNLGWRLHAQRLLTEQRATAAAPALLARLQQGGIAAPHALEVLQALGVLSPGELEAALGSTHEATVARALAHADVAAIKRAFVANGTFRGAGRNLADALVRLAGSAADPEIGAALVELARTREREVLDDATLRDAWSIAARRHVDTVLAAADAKGLQQKSKEAQPNLLPNPTFTDVDGSAPRGWNDLRIYGGARAPDVQFGTSPEGRAGTACLRVSTERTSDCGIAAVVKVQKATRYRLSGWIRTEHVKPRAGEGAMLNVHGGVHTKGVHGSSDWTQVSVEFDNRNADEIVVHCLFGGYGGATGTAWFDDVALQPIGSSHNLAGALEMLATFRSQAQAPAAAVQRQFAIDDAVHARGAAVYARTCVACHGIDGLGLPKTFPPLDGSDWVTGEARLPIDIVLHGLVGPVKVGDKTFDTVMAPLGHVLNDAEIADVVTYVRQRWSNDAAAVTQEQVAARRAATRERTMMWFADELRK